MEWPLEFRPFHLSITACRKEREPPFDPLAQVHGVQRGTGNGSEGDVCLCLPDEPLEESWSSERNEFPPLAKNKFIALCLQLLCPHSEDHQPTFLCRSISGETVSEYPLAVGMRF